jgi:hypothetical protein
VSRPIGIQLTDPAGTVLADISGIAAGRQWSRQRNNSDDVQFTLSLDKWEAYCRKLGIHPRELLRLRWTEVRVREGDVWLAAGRVEGLNTALGDGTIKIHAGGFLDLLRKRRTAAERVFTAMEATDIAWTLIDESQGLPNGDLHLTLGPNQATAGAHDRTYKRTVIKDALQALTEVQTSPFDFEITPLKDFNTYLQLGSARPDIKFKWGVNILDAAISEDTADLVNEVTALGSGFGDDAVAQVVKSNDASEVDYGLAQEVLTSNATDNSDGGLDNEASAYLAAWANPVVLIDVVVDGNKPPFVTDYGLGDYVSIDLTGHPWLDGVKGLFRVQAQTGTISDDDERSLKLTVSA